MVEVKTKRKHYALALVLLVALPLLAYFVYAQIPKPGVWLQGSIKIRYEDGSEVVINTFDQPLMQSIIKQAVITYGGKKVWGISTDVKVKFIITPPDKSLNCQWWIIYWIELSGPYFTGTRSYSSLLGFQDWALNHYTTTKPTNKWMAKVENPEIGWFYIKSFVEPFYAESMSCPLVDLTTYITDPKAVTDALRGVPIAGYLVDTLTARITSKTVWNGYNPLLVGWKMQGWDFYTRLKRMNWNGLSFHTGDFSIGGGEFARLWEGDNYKLSFKVGYFFRHQDVTGEWTKWKHGTVTLGTLELRVVEGTWYVLSADISGDARIDV